jgi:hypothetical protein
MIIFVSDGGNSRGNPVSTIKALRYTYPGFVFNCVGLSAGPYHFENLRQMSLAGNGLAWSSEVGNIGAVFREIAADGFRTCEYKFFKDGVQHGTNLAAVACPVVADGGCVVLGQEQYGATPCTVFRQFAKFAGNMTEVRLWSVARTEAEILAGFNERQRIDAEAAASEPGLVALWPLDCTYEFKDIKGGLHLGSCSPNPLGDNEPYSLASLAHVPECCQDECYDGTHDCENKTCHNTKAGFNCNFSSVQRSHSSKEQFDPDRNLDPKL